MGTQTLAENLQTVRSVLLATRDCGASALSTAIYNGHIEVVEQLLSIVQILPAEKQPQIIQSVLGNANKLVPPPLYIAAQNGHLNIVKRLTRILQDAMATESEEERIRAVKQTLEATGTIRATPLYIAARKGHYPIVEWLLEHGASPKKGLTSHPLGKCRIFRALLTQTPRQAAIRQQHSAVSGRLRAALRERKTDTQPQPLTNQ